MFKRFVDYLFPKYIVHWDFVIPPHNIHLKGCKVHDSKRGAKYTTREMNKDYGEGTHWVTDAEGNRI